VAAFLPANPKHRNVVRRIQLFERLPSAKARDNLIAADMVPIDLLRCALTFCGSQPGAPAVWEILNRRAYRTLLPETQASRASPGAGASSRDSD